MPNFLPRKGPARSFRLLALKSSVQTISSISRSGSSIDWVPPRGCFAKYLLGVSTRCLRVQSDSRDGDIDACVQLCADIVRSTIFPFKAAGTDGGVLSQFFPRRYADVSTPTPWPYLCDYTVARCVFRSSHIHFSPLSKPR